MKEIYFNLVKHTIIYGLGEFLARLSSFLLLPVYTAYLTPTDYGCIAILDLTSAVLSILVFNGVGSAVNRYHFEMQSESEQDAVWWTGLTLLVSIATGILGLAWLLRTHLARLMLGADYDHSDYYYTLILLTFWCNTIGDLPENHLRVRKWSGLYVGLAMARLCLNIGLNLYFLIVLRLGMQGIFLGNLMTSVVRMSAFAVIFVCTLGPYRVQSSLVREFWQFGSPIIIVTFLSMIMHQADRYLLRIFLDLHEVGIYALAYTIGQAVNGLCLLPFSSIWNVTMYELAVRPDAKEVYAKVFQYFIYGLMLVMLGVSLFAKLLVSVVVDPTYAEVVDLIPIICLAYIFFSIHGHFNVPVLLAKRTSYLVPTYFVAAVANIGINLLAIPWLGRAGAAWTSVLTFVIFSLFGLWRYRAIDKYPYPLLRCGCILLGMSVSYIAYKTLDNLQIYRPLMLSIAATILLAWGIILYWPFIWKFVIGRRLSLVQLQSK